MLVAQNPLTEQMERLQTGKEAIKHIDVHAKIRWNEFAKYQNTTSSIKSILYVKYSKILRVYFDTFLLLGERKKGKRRQKSRRTYFLFFTEQPRVRGAFPVGLLLEKVCNIKTNSSSITKFRGPKWLGPGGSV